MHPRLVELSEFLERRRAELIAAVDAVPADARERRATPDGWSVAQVVDHLARVEGGTTRLLARRAARAREEGVGPDAATDSVLRRLDRFDVAESPLPRVAPEMVRPGDDARADDALAALGASRAALLATLREMDGVDLTRVHATHAALGELDAYQWLLFLGEHEARHARQIAAIRSALMGDGGRG